MARPLRGSVVKLKRLARYLLRYKRGVLRYRARPEETGAYVDIYSDSDWAGRNLPDRPGEGPPP